jgi:bacteriorhodopsin
MKKIVFIITMMFCSLITFAQEAEVEMADEMRASGKIYVVVAVMVILFSVFIVYLFTIDKRLKKVENQK